MRDETCMHPLFFSSQGALLSIAAALYYQVWHSIWVPCGVWITSILYWSSPRHGWRRRGDQMMVVLGGGYQWYTGPPWYAWWLVLSFVCYVMARRSKDYGTQWHQVLHLVANLGNVLLYRAKKTEYMNILE